MAHTNQTPNYGLSQFEGTDKPAWLVDYNGDMEKIDLGLKGAKDVADAAKEEADQGAIDIAAVTVTANSADAKASGAVSNIADAYDSTSTYSVGDYVIYNNILYRCITNITVPESFDGTHWARTTVDEIIEGVNSDLDQLNSDLVNIKVDSVQNHYDNDKTISSETTLLTRTFTITNTAKILINYFAPYKVSNNSGFLRVKIDDHQVQYAETNSTAEYIMVQGSYSGNITPGNHTITITLSANGTSATVKGYTTFGMNFIITPY